MNSEQLKNFQIIKLTNVQSKKDLRKSAESAGGTKHSSLVNQLAMCNV